jgi:hypothetical protein
MDSELNTDTLQLLEVVQKFKSNATPKMSKWVIGEKVYPSENVADGFDDSISLVKKLDSEAFSRTLMKISI